MALKDLLYRCPCCGHGPTEGSKDRARCSRCGREFLRSAGPARVEVTASDGQVDGFDEPVSRPLGQLVARIERLGGPFLHLGADRQAADGAGAGAGEHETPVRVRRSLGEDGVRLRGELLGFTERLGPPSLMRLRLTRSALELLGAAGLRHRWNLMDLRAVQASSSSLQVYTLCSELVHLRFLEDSAFRWESLLQARLRSAYRGAGKGEIVEFQPRIVVE